MADVTLPDVSGKSVVELVDISGGAGTLFAKSVALKDANGNTVSPASPGAQTSTLITMQSAATINGNGAAATVDGYNGAQVVEIAETGGGTGTIALQGSYDNTNWISGVGYQQIDNIAGPTRAVSSISVLASSRHAYQVLDAYKYLRAVLSGVAGGATITARVFCEPI